MSGSLPRPVIRTLKTKYVSTKMVRTRIYLFEPENFVSRSFFGFFRVAKPIGSVDSFYYFQTTSPPSLASLKIVDTSWISPQRGSFPWAEKDCRRMNGFASDARWRRNTSWEPTLRGTTSPTLMLSANTSGDFRTLSIRKGLTLRQRKDNLAKP